jgi:hypothetical protein
MRILAGTLKWSLFGGLILLPTGAWAAPVQLQCTNSGQTIECSVDYTSSQVRCAEGGAPFFSGPAQVSQGGIDWTQPGPPVTRGYHVDRYSGKLTMTSTCAPGYCNDALSHSSVWDCKAVTPQSRQF